MEEDCIIWAVKADAARIFSGDSNGMLVVHDFWKGDMESDMTVRSNESNINSGEIFTSTGALKNSPLSPSSKRSKLE